jgi:hypothetical protein
LVGEEDKAEQDTASVETGWTKRKDGLVTGKVDCWLDFFSSLLIFFYLLLQNNFGDTRGKK